MTDKRSEPRNPCFLRADIILSHNAEPVPAEAHDISDRGARLHVLNTRALPDEFVISIPRRKIRETVKVVRRGEKELGVIFKTAIKAPA